MYCIHCGKEILETAKFCPHCGGAQSTETEENYIEKSPQSQQTISVSSDQTSKSVKCPQCGSHDCQITTKTTSQATSGGYSCLGGACGGILMGPIGLLMGLCGRKATATTTSENVWICHNCGKEFITIEAAVNKLNSQFATALICSLFGSLCIGLGLSGGILLKETGFFLVFAVLGGGLIFLAVALFPKIDADFLGYQIRSLVDESDYQKKRSLRNAFLILPGIALFGFMLILALSNR